ncbi:hypothetical protein [Streptomyces sclerotialus]|uniref:hypothetical protein n=1 Tax=Streptomyces sclerotialus TaxID=1957 RepID=UPI0004C7183D
MSPPSLRSFSLDHILDDHGRIPAVLGRDASDVVTADRALRDAALAVLTLGGPHDQALTARPLDALRESRDTEAMGAQPADVPACAAWIAARQSADGGFSRLPGGPSETTDEGFIALQALHMLEQKLNPYWAVIMT